MIPHLFHKEPLPEKLPVEIHLFINKLHRLRTQEACLDAVAAFVRRKYTGCYSWQEIPLLFVRDPKVLWEKATHCTNLNWLVRILLVKSGHFKDSDIGLKYTLLIISPHQYLVIRLRNKKRVVFDPWALTRGLSDGDYAHGFHW